MEEYSKQNIIKDYFLNGYFIKLFVKKIIRIFQFIKSDLNTCISVSLIVAFISWIFYTIYLFLWAYISPIIANEMTITLLNTFKDNVIEHKFICIVFVILFFGLMSYLSVKVEVQNQLDQLAKIKQDKAELSNPERYYDSLKEYTIVLKCATNLIPFFDPAEKNGAILPLISALRLHFVQNFGFVFPNVRVMDDSTLADDSYFIFVQGDCVFKGNIKDKKQFNFNLKCSNHICEEQYRESALMVINDLGNCIIANIDNIYSRLDFKKTIRYLKSTYKSEIYDLVLSKFSENDLRAIFSNLIREKVSIRNYAYIFEKIYKYSEFYKTTDEISERLRIDLLKQATISIGYEKTTLYTIQLDKEFENLIKNSIQIKENSKVINLEKTNYEKLKQTILNLFKEHCEKEPVILCSKEIRLPLFRLLSKYVPHISVYAKEELSKNIKLANIAEIRI